MTKLVEILVEVSGPLQGSIPFNSEDGNASFERVYVVDDLLTFESTQHDLERRR